MASNNSRSVIGLVKDAFTEWKEDNASRLAASLAYYTTFSMAPLLILIIAIAGLLGGQDAVHNQVMTQIEGLVGAQGKDFVESLITSASEPRKGLLPAELGLLPYCSALWGCSLSYRTL
jgi:membrane protein